METFILKSMTDFVLEQNEKINKNFKKNILMTQGETLDELNNFVDVVTNYANFLKKPLKLGYFIPCDENDVPLEEPKHYDLWNKHGSFTQYGESIVYKCNKFYEAKQRVLFEGFYLSEDGYFIESNIIDFLYIDEEYCENKTIEDLSKFYKLKLTETAKKEIGYDKNSNSKFSKWSEK